MSSSSSSSALYINALLSTRARHASESVAGAGEVVVEVEDATDSTVEEMHGAEWDVDTTDEEEEDEMREDDDMVAVKRDVLGGELEASPSKRKRGRPPKNTKAVVKGSPEPVCGG